MKKIVLASLILAATTAGVASANPAPYIGISSGVIVNTADLRRTHDDNGLVGIGSYRGVPLNVFAGYGGLVNCNIYLGGEIFATAATANISDNKLQLKSTYGFGAAFIPGVMFSDRTMGYVRAGIVKSHFRTGRHDSKATRNGAQFGVGLQTNLCQNLDLRGEYDFVAYRSVRANVVDANNLPHRASVSPRSDQFTLGLVYKFD